MNVNGDPPVPPWGAASTVHPGSEYNSKVLNMFLLFVVPVFALLIQKRRRAVKSSHLFS